MDLPLKIRERIYGFLLQVAGVIILKQNKTPLQHYPTPYSNMDSRILKPGIAWASTQTIMGAGKARFWSHPSTNVRILRANKQVYAEAKPLLYGINLFEFSNLSNESSPRADFSIPIFPRGIPKLIKHVCIRAGAFYGLGWMLQHGHKHLKNYYRGVESLILILELGAVTRGYGKILARQDNEKWVTYVERIQQSMRLMGGVRENVDDILKWQLKPVPTWIDFRVVFQAERIMDGVGMDEKYEEELDVKKVEIKRAVAEAFELFKRGGF
ncbi:hypothetical protein BCR34DRAFT_553258 [Clohesyomyces aquaticus]|uniref:Uncharacterized protein n=1 Tax=Clohesyomyces aquaticus TaxID=1231657 RepID=A0A1Y2A817_9PLEO|nr:hypothetical protein BCR34DRAFT_553258 [Clohesyomyces aquaticus]